MGREQALEVSRAGESSLAEVYAPYKTGLDHIPASGRYEVLGERVMLYAVLKEDLTFLAKPAGLLTTNAMFYVVMKAGDLVPRKTRRKLRPGTLVAAASAAVEALDWTDEGCRHCFIHHRDIMYRWGHTDFAIEHENKRRRANGQELLCERSWLAKLLLP